MGWRHKPSREELLEHEKFQREVSEEAEKLPYNRTANAVFRFVFYLFLYAVMGYIAFMHLFSRE